MTFYNQRLTGRARRRSIIPMFSAIIIGVFCSLHTQGQVSTHSQKRFDPKFLDQKVETMMHAVGVPALSLAVIENDKVVFSNAYGYKQLSKKDKVNRNTVFEACSLSKPFLAFVAHQLVDEGKLDLDKPLYQYMEYKPLEHDGRYKLITARMILSHASGIENWKSFNNTDTLEIICNPGERYVYSGEGYNYLAEAVSAILNQSYEQYITDRIINKLNLNNTFLKYNEKSNQKYHKINSPSNYAIGHNFLGGEISKWKNTETLAASGQHVTAEDYAKFFLSFFNKSSLSDNRVKDILKPVIPLLENDSSKFYGPGFEVLYLNGDTIIAHGGSNPGFKANIFYSVVRKKGFVFFSNSDRGIVMASGLSEMTAGLDLHDYFKAFQVEQYPTLAINLANVFVEKGAPALFKEIERLNGEGKVSVDALNRLGFELLYNDVDVQILEKLLTGNVKMNPESEQAHYLLGSLYMRKDLYDLAYKNFKKAEELGFDSWQIERVLNECKKIMAVKARDAEARASLISIIDAKEKSSIRAESYSQMEGVRLQKTSDAGGGKHVGFLDMGDWLDYKLNISVSGIYSVTFRVASLNGGGRIQLRSGPNILTTVDVPATKGWSNWTNLTTNIHLSAEDKTLHLQMDAGGFALNWLEFSLVKVE